MIESPSAAELLSAMERTLTRDVLPEASGSAKHAVRVVANLCSVLAREAVMGPESAEETRGALEVLLGIEGDIAELVAALDDRLADDDPNFETEALPLLIADAKRRLAIARPGYG